MKSLMGECKSINLAPENLSRVTYQNVFKRMTLSFNKTTYLNNLQVLKDRN